VKAFAAKTFNLNFAQNFSHTISNSHSSMRFQLSVPAAAAAAEEVEEASSLDKLRLIN